MSTNPLYPMVARARIDIEGVLLVVTRFQVAANSPELHGALRRFSDGLKMSSKCLKPEMFKPEE